MSRIIGRRKALALALTALAILATGRAAEPQATPGPPVGSKDEPSAVIVEISAIKAKVDSVDQEKRLVTLTGPKGHTVTVKVGPEVRNLAQVKPGDTLTVRYFESVALGVRKRGEPPAATEAAVVEVEVAPKGQKPAGVMVETKEVTASVEAIDYGKRVITLKGPAGKTRMLKVDARVKRLQDVKKGDKVVVRYTEGLAIYVKTP